MIIKLQYESRVTGIRRVSGVRVLGDACAWTHTHLLSAPALQVTGISILLAAAVASPLPPFSPRSSLASPPPSQVGAVLSRAASLAPARVRSPLPSPSPPSPPPSPLSPPVDPLPSSSGLPSRPPSLPRRHHRRPLELAPRPPQSPSPALARYCIE